MLNTLSSLSNAVASSSILVVNSQLQTQEKISLCLNKVGFTNVTLVNTAKKAIQCLRQCNIDLLVSDIEIDDLDGWRLSRLVRSGALECAHDLPVILVSSTWCERIAEVTAREFGINELISLVDLHKLPEKAIHYLSNDFARKLELPRLLVIEDQQDTADLIQRVLRTQFAIEVAHDGEEGLAAWQDGRHELVLLDIMLPKKSGKEVLNEILQVNPQQAVVIMTAHSSGELAEEMMLNGATDFLTKPFRTEQLRKVCDLASHREDFLVSNMQFAARVESLAQREREHRKLSETYQQLLHNLQTVVIELDSDLNIRFLNSAWLSLMGYGIEDSLGRPFADFMTYDKLVVNDSVTRQFEAVLNELRPHCEMDISLKNAQGEPLWASVKATRSKYTDQASCLTICLDDITDKKKAQEELEHLAMHDSLTGLYNRHFFKTSLDRLAADAMRNNCCHGLIYIDLDYFKVVNDTFGHHVGDEVLREVGKLIRNRVRHSDIICRLGGDEFALLLSNTDKDQILDVARDVQNIITDLSMQADGQQISIGSSLGLSLIDGLASSSEEYLMHADIALYVAKGRGRNLVHLYNSKEDESETLRSSINWSQKVRKAIDEDRVVLYFQPIYNITKQSVAYYEALVRIKDDDGTIVYPDNFIPALESLGDSYVLDRWIIKLAINAVKNCNLLNHVAINLSAQAFKDEHLVPTIVELLKKTGVSASCITFELTESASLFNLSVTQRIIAELHELGCSFAIDDFGSGFSSFAYLKQLPADYIKLDGSFIRRLDRDPVDQALVRAIIQVVQALGKKAVAEFVENEEIFNLLKSFGVDYAQGYHIGRPAPVEMLTETTIPNEDTAQKKINFFHHVG